MYGIAKICSFLPIVSSKILIPAFFILSFPTSSPVLSPQYRILLPNNLTLSYLAQTLVCKFNAVAGNLRWGSNAALQASPDPPPPLPKSDPSLTLLCILSFLLPTHVFCSYVHTIHLKHILSMSSSQESWL